MSFECTNINAQHQLMLTVMNAGEKGVPVALSLDLEEHLKSCPHCSSAFSSWVAGSLSMKRLLEESEVMERGALGDSLILRRRVREGTALFRPSETEEALGLMVIVGDGSPYEARRVARISRAEFENWE
jgi:hypothetical protein